MALVFVLAGCGSAGHLQAKAVESQILPGVIRGMNTDRFVVDCPDGESRSVGTAFTCLARFTGRPPAGFRFAKDFIVNVRVTDPSGRVTWQVIAHG